MDDVLEKMLHFVCGKLRLARRYRFLNSLYGFPNARLVSFEW